MDKEPEIERDIAALKKLYFAEPRIKKMDALYRYDLGEHTRTVLLQMSLVFDIGWKSTNPAKKQDCYETASGYLYNFQHNIDQMNDVNIITNDKKALFDILIEKLDRQLAVLSNSIAASAKRRSGRAQTPTAGGTHY